MAQDSLLGVNLTRDIAVAAIGQADDTVLVSNNLHSLQNLLHLSIEYCKRYNVELCQEKTKLQALSLRRHCKELEYLKDFSPVALNGIKLKFSETAEHVGVIRSTSGNLPNIMTRISSHKRAMAAVIHSGAAKNHRANPAASLRLEKMYGAPVLMSGLGSLILTKSEISHITKHHKETLRQLLRLPPRTP